MPDRPPPTPPRPPPRPGPALSETLPTFERVARVLEQHQADQPILAGIASLQRSLPLRLHCVFTAWGDLLGIVSSSAEHVPVARTQPPVGAQLCPGTAPRYWWAESDDPLPTSGRAAWIGDRPGGSADDQFVEHLGELATKCGIDVCIWGIDATHPQIASLTSGDAIQVGILVGDSKREGTIPNSVSTMFDVLLSVRPSTSEEATGSISFLQARIASAADEAMNAPQQGSPLQTLGALLSPGAPWRTRLELGVQGERARAMCRLIESVVSTTSQALTLKRIVEVERERTAVGRQNTDEKRNVDELRQTIQETLQDAVAKVSEEWRRGLMVSGHVRQSLRRIIDDMPASAIEKVPESRVTKLVLNAEYKAGIDSAFRKILEDEVKKSVKRINDGVVALRQAVDVFARSWAVMVPRDAELAIDDKKLRRAILRLSALDLKFHGEMPRRTLIQRFADGRRVLVPIGMLLSLLGGAFGSNLRGGKLLGVVSIILFVGGFVHTFFAWRSEDEERMGKELRRAKEQLETDGLRLLTELSREYIGELTKSTDELKRVLLKSLDECVQQMNAKALDRTEHLRALAKGNLRVVEERLRSLAALGADIRQLRSQLSMG